MHEGNRPRSRGKGAPLDLEAGKQPCLTKSNHSWSSYPLPPQVQFRVSNYGKESCQTPHLQQIEFSARSDLENQKAAVQQAAHSRSPLVCGPLSSHTRFSTEHMTPGILRPEEHHNHLGRCRHNDDRFDDVSDLSAQHRSENDSNTTDDYATLVGSPRSQTPHAETEDHFTNLRHPISSCSSYSSRASDNNTVLSTRQLIRYYTRFDSDQEECLTTRVPGRVSCPIQPYVAKEAHKIKISSHALPSRCSKHQSPFLSHQEPNAKLSPSSNEECKASARPQPRIQNATRRFGLSDGWVEKNVYILKLCKAFLLFGIQAHRLEGYLHITAAYLEIAAEFQYIPHCMLMVLTNPELAANHVHLLKESTTVDLGKLEDVYHVYEAVIERHQDLRLSIRQLDGIMRRRRMYTNLLLILLHGLAALCAGTFAFSARPIDFGPLFLFGCLLAILQLIVVRTPIRHSHFLEVLTCVIITFASRALGSIRPANGNPLFCFSGITQGTVALILPGHIILAATHEIQHRQILSGSIKMVYAILYTLFLGFGILIGTTLFGFLDGNAVNATTCDMPWYWDTLATRWRATYAQFVWVPLFAMAISIMHQAKKKHLPAMVFVATCGHQAFYWSLWRFAQNLQFAGMIAAFTSGILANIYAHIAGCLAATILLPAVLVQIPNALAASGSLVAGVGTADAIVTNQTYWLDNGLTTPSIHRRDFTAKGPSGSTGLIITAGFSMAQATIGITIGLFASAFFIWPFIRRRKGILSF